MSHMAEYSNRSSKEKDVKVRESELRRSRGRGLQSPYVLMDF